MQLACSMRLQGITPACVLIDGMPMTYWLRYVPGVILPNAVLSSPRWLPGRLVMRSLKESNEDVTLSREPNRLRVLKRTCLEMAAAFSCFPTLHRSLPTLNLTTSNTTSMLPRVQHRHRASYLPYVLVGSITACRQGQSHDRQQ